MKEQINELQIKIKENDFAYEKNRIVLENRIQELELITKQQKTIQKTIEDEKK